ncbi:stage II sporulation protein M [soil metagenome]
MNRFIDERKDNWQRLEDLLSMLEFSSLRGLSKMEVREFGELYRRAASDLAIARAETRDPKLVNYLNSLVIRAHGKIYRAESQGANLVWNFFAKDFPQTFRRNWKFIALAFGVFTFFAIAGFILCYTDQKFVDTLGLNEIRIRAQTDEKWWLSLNEANQIGSSQILTNNILVSLMAFAYGAFFGIGTIYVLIMNGLSIGGVLGVCYKPNTEFGNALITFMVGHGVIELSCIFIAAGAGMLIGYALINPGDLTRGATLKKNGLEAVRLAIGCACLLVIAGIIEGFLSPSALPPFIKFGTGIWTGIAMYSYLLLLGRKEKTD